MAGYSRKPLAGKLGLKPGMRAHFAGAPLDYGRTIGRLPGVTLEPAPRPNVDFIQCFIKTAGELDRLLPRFKAALAPAGALWVSWAKKTSPKFTGVTEDAIRKVGLAHGLVDVKVCAVTDDFSGLKFMFRLKDRR